MNGFLGTSATFLADLSLVLALLFGAIAIGGAIQARRNKFSTHCPVMAVAALLNWIPILLVMIPTWVDLLQAGQIFVEFTSLTPVFHGSLGGLTQVLMTYTVVRMYWLDQLAVGGTLVIPTGPEPRLQTLVRVRRVSPEETVREELEQVRFVPLIGKAGWNARLG